MGNLKKFWLNGGSKLIIQGIINLLMFIIIASFVLGKKEYQIQKQEDRISTLEKMNTEILQRLANIEGKLDLLIKQK